MEYTPTIGLEIHVELKTLTKMFCGCLNDPNEKHPNINVCPICMGHPGTLPVINKEAVKKVLTAGKALNGKLAGYSRFDRKNYFYPDLPKGYQISQYKYPLVREGELKIKSQISNLKSIKINRIHLEEDTGRSAHIKEGSLIDYNRAGMPLMELVTQPVIGSGEQARKFAEELQLVLRYLGVSDADMEKGQMRVEANISLRKNLAVSPPLGGETAKWKLGIKVEIKNLNSFRAVERAINYEIERQSKILDNGESVKHETRGWDENKQKTFSQREKEKSHDYRYFPEPDLPALNLATINLGGFAIPELPQQKRERFKKEYNLKDEQIEIFIRDKKFADYFEEVVSELTPSVAAPATPERSDGGREEERSGGKILGVGYIQLAANYLTTDLQSLMKEKMLSFDELLVRPENFAELVLMISNGEITSKAGKDILKIMVEKGAKPSLITEERGLRQTNDENTIAKLADDIIQENQPVVASFKQGKQESMQFLIGQGMKKTKGSINPEILKKILKEKLL